ncbi:hypothetical protein OH76DRAFT_602608 [Lentinus brumalis]|uniref:Uncharacterized protein n=1 Tax=Lentinus brumalis TaxID=2498619 RepID=A0A371DUG6_9APHY|nr:hypothetical protein OH76DRAFT_602608 [Polyporus brumalis]
MDSSQGLFVSSARSWLTPSKSNDHALTPASRAWASTVEHAKTSSQSSTPWTPAVRRLQGELLALMDGELGEQIWQFPPNDIARMLSPKIINVADSPARSQEPYPPLAWYRCVIDDHAICAGVDSMSGPQPLTLVPSERLNYKPLAKWFNECVTPCDELYTRVRQKKLASVPFRLVTFKQRWFPTLVFSAYDRPTGDKFAGAPSLKPDLVAGPRELGKETVCYWSGANPDDDQMPIDFAVAVKDNWKALVMQAATYARAQISAVPLPIRIDTAEGVRQVQKVLFSVLLWQTPQDAGLPLFTNGNNFLLPASASLPAQVTLAVAEQVLFHSLCVRGRGSFVVRARSTTDPPSSLQPGRQLRSSARKKTQSEGTGTDGGWCSVLRWQNRFK